ncbi:MAG: hypothetical protein NZ874_05480 [Fimbriimonadales bacterium]|nr:hypothetical protein [Fimbriimonadales bacterium]
MFENCLRDATAQAVCCADEADLRRLFSPRRRAWFAQERLQPSIPQAVSRRLSKNVGMLSSRRRRANGNTMVRWRPRPRLTTAECRRTVALASSRRPCVARTVVSVLSSAGTPTLRLLGQDCPSHAPTLCLLGQDCPSHCVLRRDA